MSELEQERTVGHTPGPWLWRNVTGAGLMVYGPVPFQANCVEFTLKAADQPLFSMAKQDSGVAYRHSETGYPMLAYETWIQFPPAEWDAMQEANARLIAAAPELLAALSSIMRWWMETPQFEAGEDEMPSELFDAAQAALAKAKGGAS